MYEFLIFGLALNVVSFVIVVIWTFISSILTDPLNLMDQIQTMEKIKAEYGHRLKYKLSMFSIFVPYWFTYDFFILIISQTAKSGFQNKLIAHLKRKYE